MAVILDGKELARKIRLELKEEVEQLKNQGIFPKLTVIMVGDDPSSKIYVRNKSKACEEIGINYDEYLLDEKTNMNDLLDLINKLNNDNSVHGILLQSPIPNHLDINRAFEAIRVDKDVDGFNPINIGRLSLGEETFVPCTPFGVMKILEEYNIEVERKRAVIVGRSNIVGKPMIQCLLNKNATVTICHSKTKDLEEITKTADILVSAIGKPKFITQNMVKDGAIIIDVGTTKTQSRTLRRCRF